MAELRAAELEMLNRWQRDFPLVPRPFARMARETGAQEGAVIAAVRRLLEAGVVCRIGAVVRPNTAGASTLAALAAPPERLEEIALFISRQPEVTHNYEREHALNLWFVVTAADRAGVNAALERIRAHTGLEVLDLPMIRAFHIDLGFALPQGRGGRVVSRPRAEAPPAPAAAVTPQDRRILAAMEDGLEPVPRPFAALGRTLGMDEAAVIARISAMTKAGVIRRFGLIVQHRELGFSANAMVVWDIPDEAAAAAGELLAGVDYVTLCYQRPRRPPRWRYNLFCMIHGESRRKVLRQVRTLAELLESRLGLRCIEHAPLFSTRRFKQCGARFSAGLTTTGAA